MFRFRLHTLLIAAGYTAIGVIAIPGGFFAIALAAPWLYALNLPLQLLLDGRPPERHHFAMSIACVAALLLLGSFAAFREIRTN
jgi:hypothetical protein